MTRIKVLLADDVELFLMLEKTVFNRNEFELITARSGSDILKLIRKDEPDLVFMNLNMPGLNGDECCRIVKGDTKSQNIPIIMVMECNSEINNERCRLSGCDDILCRPIVRSEFLATTRKYLKVLERADQRFRTRLRIKYSVGTFDNHDNYSIDINSGGLFLETENPLTIGTPLDLEFQIPTSNSVIRCRARGAWVNGPKERRKPNLPIGMGLQFLNLSAEDTVAINEFVSTSGSVTTYC